MDRLTYIRNTKTKTGDIKKIEEAITLSYFPHERHVIPGDFPSLYQSFSSQIERNYNSLEHYFYEKGVQFNLSIQNTSKKRMDILEFEVDLIDSNGYMIAKIPDRLSFQETSLGKTLRHGRTFTIPIQVMIDTHGKYMSKTINQDRLYGSLINLHSLISNNERLWFDNRWLDSHNMNFEHYGFDVRISMVLYNDGSYWKSSSKDDIISLGRVSFANDTPMPIPYNQTRNYGEDPLPTLHVVKPVIQGLPESIYIPKVLHLSVIADKDGSIKRLFVMEPVLPTMQEAVVEAVSQWKFDPVALNNSVTRINFLMHL